MQRIHAFEFTDLTAVPDFIRASIVEVLGGKDVAFYGIPNQNHG